MTVFLKVSDENTDRRHALKFLFTTWDVNNAVRFSAGFLGVGLRRFATTGARLGFYTENPMHADTACDLPALYHQTEDHYFAATCSLHRRYNACINAYFTDDYFDPWNLLFIRVGSAPMGGAMAVPMDLLRRIFLDTRVVIHEEKVGLIAEALMGMGFQPAEKTTAMVLDLSSLVSSTDDSSVQISLTRNLADWAVPLGNAFSMPPEGIARYQARHQRALETGQSLHHFILSTEGQVRCSLTLSLCNGEARLNDVGTLVGFRTRGYATRLIQAALRHASSLGARRCFLEATMDGISVYRKLGFEGLFDYQSFIRGPVAVA
ncbi:MULTISPECIES: GNAT family N-acetyltransferase [unclassified Pseudomonas]|uniref:GNAT family N-acetyltransferase n=1 Tax=unclassified Pseudomonas TaxID=196821 RepID=UPI00273D76CD|nr:MULTISPECIES: GNAT family N-acetyltransferase [unclassified Pseudomonas]